MNAIRKFTLASAAAIALSASSGASAADYLFEFQFDALTSNLGTFAATNTVYSADSLDPNSLTYVSGSVNGSTSPTLRLGAFSSTGQRAYVFQDFNVAAPVGTIADIFFSVFNPFAAGQTYETTQAGRGIRTSGGAWFEYTTGRLTITQVPTAVPEPATWAMLILGFGLVGGALRRRGALRSVRVAYS